MSFTQRTQRSQSGTALRVPHSRWSTAHLSRCLVQVWRHFAPAKSCRLFRVPHARDLPYLSPEAWFSFPPSSAPSGATL